MTEPVLDRLTKIRIVPVVVIDDDRKAGDLATALLAGGIPCAEFALRTPAALTALHAASQIPGFTVGAGTVLTVEDVDRAADAGAEFIVSPGFDDEVVERALHHGLAVLPGIATATELQRARRAGIESVKFFPADQLGGVEAIAALAAPFPTMRFLPSGGIGPDNAERYLAHPSIFAVAGSWMVPNVAIAARAFGLIEELCAQAVARVRG